ncbi:MAG: MMPL family transporter [Corynebacterium sp.]|uniref:MMPL family transporter n=2 Tax=Corynebacteriaceae TaxID=1653 RepID=UPI002647E1A9|nr:MMPL family transporter [Corynebacterium sp.]MDN6281651.1 MMPL family transporter [Corynebacterium sp.]MDN6305035.1 MMPL family transporter [Corynebacterium sp.]MDN6367292.1 MMPL family transporter [Corynebacterium sp.]MDN6376946.1 MMPL family transporter [Corynebacterium sp.]MDN6396495.1 MMPL family transporter [Corynebacterium sp.]
MAKFLYRVGRSAYMNRWRFIAVWLLVLIGAGTLMSTMAKSTSMTFTIPGLESVETQEEMAELFPEGGDDMEAPTGTIVVRAPEGGSLTDEATKADLDALIAELKEQDALVDTDAIVDPMTAAAGMEQQMAPAKQEQGMPEEQIQADLQALSPLSENGRTGTMTITFEGDTSMDVSTDDVTAVTDVLDDAATENLEIAYGGNVFQMPEIGATAELIGIAVAAIILIITFGSFVAAGLPLITAIVGVGTGIMLIMAATALTDNINSMTPTLASMIGLAVGIDYALFIVSRFRNELVAFAGGNNMTPKELAEAVKKTTHAERAHLAGLAVGKAGSAVCFAGLTVVIALAALSIINIPFLTAMALAAAFTVVIAVLVAITLLPAVLGAFGARSFAGRAPVVKAPDPEDEKPTMGLKWVRQVRKRPVIFAAASALLLVLLAIPVASLQLAMPTDDSAKLGSPQRNAAEWVNEDFGPGRNAPMIAVVKDSGDDPMAAQATFGEAVATISGVDGVENAQVAGMSEDGTAAMVMITPTTGGNDALTADTLQSLRDAEPAFKDQTGGTYSITGVTPIFEDVSDRLSEVLIPYVAIVVVLAFVLLVVVFRSLWVPLIAALGFALSVAATFGVTVAVWQWGWLGITNDPQPIISFLPIMLIGIVFGLAMDYQVFLVTRMREGYVHGKTAGNAVSNGFKHGARVVTAAALIMISVFSAFILMDEPFIAVMGSALAMAVLIDAFVVRMTIVPAVLFLLGDRAWKLPAWLDKIIPSVDVEGTTLEGMEATTDEKKAVETAPSNG